MSRSLASTPTPTPLQKKPDGILVYFRVPPAFFKNGMLAYQESQRNCQSKVLYPGTDITIHRLADVNGGMLCFLWEWSASLVTLLPPHPIDSTVCYACTSVGTLEGGGTIGHSRPRREVQHPLPLYRSVHG